METSMGDQRKTSPTFKYEVQIMDNPAQRNTKPQVRMSLCVMCKLKRLVKTGVQIVDLEGMLRLICRQCVILIRSR